MSPPSQLLLFAVATQAQQYYISASGPTPRPQCPANPSQTQPSYAFSSFSFSMNETVRIATSVPAPTTTQTYAAPSDSLASLVPSLSYTTWGKWNPNATTSASDTDDRYGNAAWTALWVHANPPSFTETGLYNTTVSPTPVPSSELVLPPRDYFGPNDCYYFPQGFMFGVSGSSSQIEGAVAGRGQRTKLNGNHCKLQKICLRPLNLPRRPRPQARTAKTEPTCLLHLRGNMF